MSQKVHCATLSHYCELGLCYGDFEFFDGCGLVLLCTVYVECPAYGSLRHSVYWSSNSLADGLRAWFYIGAMTYSVKPWHTVWL